ncbi:MAG TPA: ABC transporter substrate-binding protein, partial [Dehalococcoidia bacterium]|nr:ABC transporter substrate-binding protein [Dehalococcoidia bacterium]
AKTAASPVASPATKTAASPSPAAKTAASPSPAAKTASPQAGTGATSGTIKIVSSLPRTGSSKGQTDTIVNAIRMAFEEEGNRAGNFTIVYEDWDDATAAQGQWDAAKETENATRAANDPQVMAYIGTFNSGAAAVAIPILNQAGLLMVSPANTAPGLTKSGTGEPGEPEKYYPTGRRNYTRVVPADDIQGAAGATWAQELGAKSVWVIDDAQLYGKSLADVFAQTAQRLGLEVKGRDSIDGKASDYRALALKIRQANPDLIYFGGITQNNAGQLWKDLRNAMPQVRLMGPDGIREQAFLEAAGDAAQGSHITFGGLPPDKLTGKGAEWYQRYKAKYNSEPEAYAAYGYEAAKVVLEAIKRAGRADRNAIRDAVFATADFEGVLGRWSFDQNGDTSLTTMSGEIVQPQGGRLAFVFNKELRVG